VLVSVYSSIVLGYILMDGVLAKSLIFFLYPNEFF
jgi:hypothetical protein